MPKYRKLWTKTTESLDLLDMPDDFTRLSWVMLPLILDREGRGIDNPAWVRSKLFPMRSDIDDERMKMATDWWAERCMIQRYEVDGRRYFVIPTWHAYQGDTRKETESTLPPPPPVQVLPNSGATPAQLPTKSGTDADADSYSQVDAQVDADQSAAPAVAIDTYLKASGGAINPILAERINGLVDELEAHRLSLSRVLPGAAVSGDLWVANAIVATVEAIGKPSIKYTTAILDRWRTEGYRSKQKERNNGDGDIISIQGHHPVAADPADFYGVAAASGP